MSFEKKISTLLTETFESYVLVAYDFDGKQVSMRKVVNQKDLDALYTALGREEENLGVNNFCDDWEDDEEFD